MSDERAAEPDGAAADGVKGGRGAAAGDPAGGGPDVFRVVVLASGSGTNLQAIIDKLHGHPAAPAAGPPGAAGVGRTDPAGAPPAGRAASPVIEVALVVSDVPGARALERAQAADIPTVLLPAKSFDTREEHNRALIAAVSEARPDLIVLAGYMRLVSPEFVRAFPWRVINLHPALLPAFLGTTSISDAVQHGVKVTGVTVHFVDEGLDTGAIIAQEPVRVEEGDTAESLAACIHAVEHELLPATIRMIAAGKVSPPLPGTRVVQVDWNGGTDSSDSTR